MRAHTPEPGDAPDAPAEILGDPSAETITSLREAQVDGFSCGHADALSTEEEMEEHLGKGDSAGEVVTLTTFDRRAAAAAEHAAATRGVPKGYRDVWCRSYGHGAAMAHTEIVLRWRERAEVGARKAMTSSLSRLVDALIAERRWSSQLWDATMTCLRNAPSGDYADRCSRRCYVGDSGACATTSSGGPCAESTIDEARST